LNDQLAKYCQQWKSDQQKQIMIKMTGTLPGKSSDGKRKHNERINHNSVGVHNGGRQGSNGQGGRRRGRGDVACYNCDKKGQVDNRLIVIRPRKMEMKNPIWFQRQILKFISIFLEGDTFQKGKAEE
jgi:hypothetical protein